MNIKLLICLLSLLIAGHVNAQVLTTRELNSDFDTMRAGLEEAHGGLYRFYSKTEMDRHFDSFKKKLNKPMDRWEFYGLLSKMLAGIGDGHMKLEYSPAPLRPLFFPYRIMLQGKSAVILSNDTESDTLVKPGMQLLRINGKSFTQLKSKILQYLMGDGYTQSGKINSLGRNFSQYYRAFVDSTSVFMVKVRDASGKSYHVSVKGLGNAAREANRNNNPVNARVNQLTKPLEGRKDNAYVDFEGDSIAYFRIRYFVGDHFDKEIDSLMEEVAKRKIKAMVLDIRGNGGGTDEWSAFMISRLSNKPFRYLDRIHTRVLIPSFAEWKAKPPVDLVKGAQVDPNGGYLIRPLLNRTLLMQQPSNKPYTGKLVVLIDGRTFSAASDFSSVVQNISDATFVGVETGGTQEGNTSALNAILKLPNSGFKVNIHLWELWSAVKPSKNRGYGVMPDYPIERNVNDWLSGVDNQLEFALQLARK